MRKAIIVAAIAASAAFGGAALADGFPSKYAAPAAPAYDLVNSWTGFYLGVGVGGGAVVHDLKVDEYGYNAAEVDGLGGQGVLGTIQVGYDKQFGRFVAGVFFDYDFTDITSKISVTDRGSVNVDLNDMWTIGGRIGYLVNTNTLVYALGGYTEANFDIPSGLKGDNYSGFSVGGGIETQLGGNWFFKGEYRFTSLDKETIISDSIGDVYIAKINGEGNNYGSFKVTNEPDIHTARFSLVYKLGGPGAPFEPLK